MQDAPRRPALPVKVTLGRGVELIAPFSVIVQNGGRDRGDPVLLVSARDGEPIKLLHNKLPPGEVIRSQIRDFIYLLKSAG